MPQILFQLTPNSIVQLWNENQISFLMNILAGVITALIAYHFRQFVVFLKDQKFRKYHGNYDVYEKYKEESSKPVFNISIKVKANKLSIRGKKIADNSKVVGTILLDRDLPEYGTGRYVHGDGWGFIQAQIGSQGRILAHHQYASKGNLYNEPYVWIKRS